MTRMLCAIPARGGSKRLPGKNILPLAGRPMLAYSIQAALDTGLFDAVYVCTDDQAIADVAQRFGAEVPFLMPPELCDDLVPSHQPCQHLAQVLGNSGDIYETLLCLQPSSPLRSVEDIVEAVRCWQDNDVDYVVSATFVDPHYFHWALQPPVRDDDFWHMYFGKQYLKERPLLPPVYRPNGSIKIARLSALMEEGSFFGERLGVVETPEERSIHVATQFDFDLCQYLLDNLQNRER
ncbi:MAG: acylneuraminate cytidylyltransferase family protein [Anaerolineae bacterium]|nr:acylneuraminate cytidylyltransferase family protein [Anaerolineae bacterium]NUQ07144.1 acylneuraminate cytidylyltransferase family protein [Anaerolineae bacterium]